MSQKTLVIGNKNYSSWSLRPWLFLSKNNIEFTEKMIWLDEPTFKPAIEGFGSGGKVPVLVEGELIIWDSLAIIETAIDRYDCQYAWPKDADLRAHARSISNEMHAGFGTLRNDCTMDIRSKHNIDISEALQQDVSRICTLWETALAQSGNQGRWLYGDFSAADAMYAPVVFRFNTYGMKVSSTVQAYMDYVMADAVLARWVAEAKLETRELYV
ncbi:MAG: glutathione S-transferase family protein [Arenicellales bacterium]